MNTTKWAKTAKRPLLPWIQVILHLVGNVAPFDYAQGRLRQGGS